MEIVKGTVRASPYLGVFALATDDVVLLPRFVEAKELKIIEKALEVEAVKVNIVESSLIGVFMAGIGKKVVVPEMAERSEVKALEHAGLEVESVYSTAIGNLAALNSKGGIISPLMPEAEKKRLENFFGVKFTGMTVAGSDVPGAAIAVTEKGFIVHPNVDEKEFKKIGKIFRVNGAAGTANYGDAFVGNDVIANSKGVVVGAYTSGHELMRIDEGLRGE